MLVLDKQNYSKALSSLKAVKINSLFARAVVEKHVTGIVYVDNIENPTTFYIVHPYGMSLLYGDHNNQAFNLAFKAHALNQSKTRKNYEWMQAYPNTWDQVLGELFADCCINSSENKANAKHGIVELNTRVNFKFNQTKYDEFKSALSSVDATIKRTTNEEFESMPGSVVPANFWDNARDFIENGIGFSLYSNGELACTAYSAFLMDGMLELGMETIPEYRGKGFAQHTCSRLIEYCLETDYEPIWACRLENTGSYRLAERLGFEPTIQVPYYRLSN